MTRPGRLFKNAMEQGAWETVEQGKIQRGGGKAGGETMTNLKKIETLWRTLKSFEGFSKSLLGFSHPPPDLRGFGER